MIPASLVLLAAGVRPNLGFAADCGFNMGQGLLVNNEMRTNLPDIFAAGDVAEAGGQLEETNLLRPLWLNAVKQGKVAGTNMAGGKMCYDGSVAMNSIDLFGLPVISMGMLNGEGLEEIVICPANKGVYQKILLHQDKLMGFIFAGDIRQAGLLASKLGRTMGEGYSGDYKNINPVCCFA
jgi:NAD(P)H-nitrite reductase large subunit